MESDEGKESGERRASDGYEKRRYSEEEGEETVHIVNLSDTKNIFLQQSAEFRASFAP